MAMSSGAREQLNLPLTDLGRPLRELELSYRPADLRAAMERVAADQREVLLKGVHHVVAGHVRYFDITVAPIFDEMLVLLGMRIMFADATAFHHLKAELSAAKQELETAHDAL